MIILMIYWHSSGLFTVWLMVSAVLQSDGSFSHFTSCIEIDHAVGKILSDHKNSNQITFTHCSVTFHFSFLTCQSGSAFFYGNKIVNIKNLSIFRITQNISFIFVVVDVIVVLVVVNCYTKWLLKPVKSIKRLAGCWLNKTIDKTKPNKNGFGKLSLGKILSLKI